MYVCLCDGTRRDASSMKSLAPCGSPSAHSRLLDRRNANLACSSSVNWLVSILASNDSASPPRPNHDNACARRKFGSGPEPTLLAASASRSARARSPNQTAPYAALTSRSACGVRSESSVNVARRTTPRMSPSRVDAASSLATTPRSRRSRLCGARLRRTSPYSGCVTRTSMPSPAGSSEMRPRVSASSIAPASVIRVKLASSIGSPTASTSTTSPTEADNAPIRDSISSTRPGGITGSPTHRQRPFC